MQIPSEFKLLGDTINVQFVPASEMPDEAVDVGYWNDIDSEICIRSGLSPVKQRDVFLHELIEAIKSRCDLTLNHQTLTTLASVLFSTLTEIESDETNHIG